MKSSHFSKSEQKNLKNSVLSIQDRIFQIFSFRFWEVRRLHIFLLKFTDLQQVPACKIETSLSLFQMSRLVVSEILTQPCVTTRVQAIEKWTAVADICRCLHNFNGILQICAAFTNSAVFRLKNAWNRASKSVSS